MSENFKMWTWGTKNTGFGIASFEEGKLYIKRTVVLEKTLDKMVDSLEYGNLPSRVFPKKRDVIPLVDLERLVISKEEGVLELWRSGESKPLTITDTSYTGHLEFYEWLRSVLAPGVEEERAQISSMNAMFQPFFFLFSLCVMTGVATIAWNINEESGLMATINNAMRWAGLSGTMLFFFLLYCLMGSWMWRRWKKPPSGLSVTIPVVG